MKKYLLILSILIFVFACSEKQNEAQKTQNEIAYNTKLPKALFITTGVNFENDNKDLPKGVIVALQSFNKQGVMLRIEPRDVLFDLSFLNQFSIIIMSTAFGYHDADRKYSLSYMTDEELNNIKSFVANGGTLIAGDNIGRNMFNGTDRILKSGVLNTENYPLAEVFGLTMKEKNMEGFVIEGNINKELNGKLSKPVQNNLWTIVPDSIISDKLTSIAYWIKGKERIPAITYNHYQKGTAYLLASSDFINPIASGGSWSVAQIEAFYGFVLMEHKKQKQIDISINPWPNAYANAFCVTFNPQGELQNYKRLLRFLKKKDIKPTFFVDGIMDENIRKYLKKQKAALASTGYRYWNYEDMDYAISVNDILRNEAKWQQNFAGFRFPFTNPVFNGVMALDAHNYKYETSISADNFEFLQGSVVPYNLVICENGYYKSTSILEIAPTYHDDYFFLQSLNDHSLGNEQTLEKEVRLHKQYLLNYWKYSVQVYNGVMVYLGHPGLTAHNQVTLSSLETLIDTVRSQNTWVTSLDSIAAYRNSLMNLTFIYDKNGPTTQIKCIAKKTALIKDFSINLNYKPRKVSAKYGDIRVKDLKEKYSIIFDAKDKQVISIEK